MPVRSGLLLLLTVLFCRAGFAEERVLDAGMHHLRAAGPREWADFPERAEADKLRLEFAAKKNNTAYTLRLRQQDLKRTWQVSINDAKLGRLARDENDMVVYLEVPAGALKDGANVLLIEQVGRPSPDDIRIGQIALFDQPRDEVLSPARIEVRVQDADAKKLTPCRITILNADGAQASVGAESNQHMAVRPGAIYSGDGRAEFGLPPGRYTIFAGRGFEWSIDRREVEIKKGETARLSLSIRREVPTEGYVACDTHIHTLTHSGHGDSSIEERMMTLAAEGIEFPIATDHNIHINYEALARKLGVRQYFTPVIGNEVTTRLGHFNVFPVRAGAPIPNFRADNWPDIFTSIYKTPRVRAVILNHARDIHGNYRPFGPEHHNAVVGQNLDGWKLKANAMELINSGATQTDALEMHHDWMGLLNRGLKITPVGSSDSHDVARHFVGQSRTYIRCQDGDVSKIDVDAAVDSFVAGRVMVSYGLLAQITVNGKYGSGQVAPAADKEVIVDARVLGPSWVTAKSITLYANGQKIRQAKISDGNRPGVKWSGRWNLGKLSHDVHLVAIATGPGVKELYWPMAKAYQPTSPVWKPLAVGSSGAAWVDADGDGRATSAYQYAEKLYKTSGGDLPKLLKLLAPYDAAVAAQAASLLQDNGTSLIAPKSTAAIQRATETTQRGFSDYIEAWRASQLARAGK